MAKKIFLFTGILLYTIGTSAQIRTGVYYVKESGYFMQNEDKTDSCYIDTLPIVTILNYKKVFIKENSYLKGNYELHIVLDEQGKDNFKMATGKSLDKKLAFVINSSLVMLPVVRSEIAGGELVITGNYDKGTLGKMKAGLEKEMKKKK